MRRTEVFLLGGFLALTVVVLALAVQLRPPADWQDPRASTYLAGPDGLKGLADVLEQLGVRVERVRHPLFGLVESGDIRPGDLLLLAETRGVTRGEWAEVARFVAGGGDVFIVGTAVNLLGLTRARLDTGGAATRLSAATTGVMNLPAPEYVIRFRSVGRRGNRSAPAEPPLLQRGVREDLLTTGDGRAVAQRITFAGGGRVVLLADRAYVANWGLKETDAGQLSLPWLLERNPQRVIVDEYHHGFGQSGALFREAGAWLVRSPLGWTLLQLMFAALVALALGAVRFGPALRVISTRRRSPIEHVEALGTALERAETGQPAVELIIAGLRRRLAGSGRAFRQASLHEWLDGLAGATHRPELRGSANRLAWLLRERGGPEHVARAATIVEDVWTALRRDKPPAKS